MPERPTGDNLFYTSESTDTGSENDKAYYVYQCLQGTNTSWSFPARLSKVLNHKTNVNNNDPFSYLPDDESSWQILYKISGYDANFVTESYVPLIESGIKGSIRDRVKTSNYAGCIQSISITTAGTGYTNGETIEFVNQRTGNKTTGII